MSKKSELSVQMRASLDKSLYMWEGKFPLRLVIAGFSYMALGAILPDKVLNVKEVETDLYFLRLGLGGLAIFVGVLIYIIRLIVGKWDGKIKK